MQNGGGGTAGSKRPRRKGVAKRQDNRISYKQLFSQLDVDLQQALARHHHLSIVHSLVQAHEQVLLDSILQHEEVALIKQAMQQPLVPAPPRGGDEQQQQHEQQPQLLQPQQQLLQPQPDYAALHMVQQAAAGSGHYVTRLLSRVGPTVVQDVLSWNSDEWHDFFEKAAVDLSLLLQVACRGANPAVELPEQLPGTLEQHGQHDQQAPPSYVLVAEQKLRQAVDRIATIGCIGSVYSERTGQALGHCTSINHITMQQEAAPPQHWAGVLQQMQLSQQQLVQLAGGFREFVRLRKVHHAAQLAVAEQASCSNSCSLQLLAASKHSSSSPSAAAVPTPPQATPVPAAAAPRSRGGGAGTPSSSCGTTPATTTATGGGSSGDGDDDAAGGSAPGQEGAAGGSSGGGDEVDTTAGLQRLLFSIHQSFAMLHSLMLNTLTHRQIARMLVAAFPFVPLPAPLMEQAYQLVMQQAAAPPPRPAAAGAAAGEDDEDDPSGEAAAAGAPAGSTGAAGGDAAQSPPPCARCAAAGRVVGNCSDDTQEFVQQRVALLVGQVQQWWLAERHLQEVAGAASPGAGGAAR